jgi:hypothetical protein
MAEQRSILARAGLVPHIPTEPRKTKDIKAPTPPKTPKPEKSKLVILSICSLVAMFIVFIIGSVIASGSMLLSSVVIGICGIIFAILSLREL